MIRRQQPALEAAEPAGEDMTADEALAAIGDDPQTLLLAIQLLDRLYAQRVSRRRRKRKTTFY